MSGTRLAFIGLAISVALNLLLVGGMIGMSLRPEPDTTIEEPARERGIPEQALARAVLADAPRGDRQAIRRDLRETWRDAAPLRRQVGRAHRKVQTTLKREPYDAGAVSDAYSELLDAEAALRQTVYDDLVTRLENVSPETRARLADAMARNARREGPRQRERSRRPAQP